MSKLLVIILATAVFSFGVLADEALKPTGWSWQRIGASRQLGYVEGFDDAKLMDMEQRFCEEAKIPAMKAISKCTFFTLRQ